MSSHYFQRNELPVTSEEEKDTGRYQDTGKRVFKEIMSQKYHEANETRPTIQKLPFSKSKEVSVAVDEMPLPDFIHYIFSDIFHVNYVVDSKVKKSKEPVTLNLNQKISEYRLFEIVVDVMKQHRLSVYIKKDIYYIWQDSKTKDIAIGIGAAINDIPATVGEIQQIVPIKYADVQNLFEFLPRGPGIKVIPAIRENMLVVTGTREQIEQVINIVNMLDRPAMRGRFAGMLRLKYWSPSDMAKKLSEILTQEGIPVTEQPGQKGIYINMLLRKSGWKG
jgi:general secretion pathway protein D